MRWHYGTCPDQALADDHCILDTTEGEAFAPKGQWTFVKKCSVHKHIENNKELIRIHKLEGQLMSFTRARVASALGTPEKEPDINFSFTEDRKIILYLPDIVSEELLAKVNDVATIFSSGRVKVVQ